MTSQLTDNFNDRLAEVSHFLDFLKAIEGRIGLLPIDASNGDRFITPSQQRMLYSSFYLQLYNLVEATVTDCLRTVIRAAIGGGLKQFPNLSLGVRAEWVRAGASTHAPLESADRLSRTIAICDMLLGVKPLDVFDLDTGSGNWDDEAIYKVSQRIGLELQLSDEVRIKAKRYVRNNQGVFALVRDLRNQLAHGNISFVQCSAGATVRDLEELRDGVAAYLREVTVAFTAYVDSHGYLLPAHRPSSAN